ncbi:MAG: phosphoenolpyruvate synthase [Acetatifactor sp.]|nr:phosphoenolpyruvate synthase [Acetatifactor sp.]
MKYVLPFEEIRKGDVSSAGGKGANLGELTMAGIPVPRGVVLSAQAYDLFMERNNIRPENFESGAALRDCIRNATLPEEVETEIRAYYATLGENARVAIRSSATAEDLEDASFAGQQETYLNVRGIETVLAKVTECYASLWGERAVSYRKNAGYANAKVSLAVVIQQMIESDASGVLFTSDPAGDPANVHVNASYGLGEAVVSGIVSPDEYICDRQGKALKTFTGSKECQILYADEGTVKVEVPSELRNKLVLAEDKLKDLVLCGLRIEEHYGRPMDIEWAIKDGKIYILQARAITTVGKTQDKTYTEADFVNYPKVLPATGRLRENVLFNLEKTPTPYFPLDHDFGGLVGEQKGVLFEEIGIQFGDSMYPIDRDGVNFMTASKPKITKNVFQIPKYLKMIKNVDENIRKSSSSLEKCSKELEGEKRQNPQSREEIGKALSRMRKLISKTAYDRFLYALFPNFLESMKVDKVLKKVPGEYNSYDVLEGLDYVTANVNREMAEMAVWIRSDENMLRDCMQKDYEQLIATYPELGKRLQSFLDNYGAKSDFNCYCFISKSWREEPDRFLKVLRPMLKSANTETPTKEEGERKFRELMSRVEQSVSAGKYRDFENRVKALRHYHYIREATQYLWESEFEYCRALLRRLERVTGMPYEEYLYLFAKELEEVCAKGITDEMQKRINHRKELRPLAVAYWNYSMETALSSGEDGIIGISGSVGQAKGKVKVVKSPAEFHKLEEGDILVCTYTDPEWTPLFCLAAGVVVDTGGTLSHAAIVAREYQIPAVLATGNATKLLKDGDIVLVDGNTGKVTQLS